MPTREPDDIERQVVTPRFSDRLLSQIDRKRQIVTRRDEAHRPWTHLGQASNKRHRTNRRPVFAQLFQCQMIRKTFPQMTRRQSPPGDVGDITGNVIESAGVDIRLMSKRKKRNARSDTGAENPDAFIALIFKPAHRRARIENSLAHRLNRAPDVRADQMIGAFQFRRPALFVIGQRQTQSRNADEVEDAAGLNVAFRLSIPLRQDNDRGARLSASVH